MEPPRAVRRAGRGRSPPGRGGHPGEGGARHRGPASLTARAAARGFRVDGIAMAAALAQPWASVVLSGAVTRAQLAENLAALTVGPLPALNLAEAPVAYWQERAARPWH